MGTQGMLFSMLILLAFAGCSKNNAEQPERAPEIKYRVDQDEDPTQKMLDIAARMAEQNAKQRDPLSGAISHRKDPRYPDTRLLTWMLRYEQAKGNVQTSEVSEICTDKIRNFLTSQYARSADLIVGDEAICGQTLCTAHANRQLDSHSYPDLSLIFDKETCDVKFSNFDPHYIQFHTELAVLEDLDEEPRQYPDIRMRTALRLGTVSMPDSKLRYVFEDENAFILILRHAVSAPKTILLFSEEHFVKRVRGRPSRGSDKDYVFEDIKSYLEWEFPSSICLNQQTVTYEYQIVLADKLTTEITGRYWLRGEEVFAPGEEANGICEEFQ